MKIISTLLLISILTIGIYAVESESTASSGTVTTNMINLNGKICDKITSENLAGVEVQLIGTDKKTYTDFDGNFEFSNIGQGAHAIKIQYISYRDVVENVFVGKDTKMVQVKLVSIEK